MLLGETLCGVVSPYDIHARAAVAETAVCLLDRAATLLPAPLEGTDPGSIQAAIEDVPSFERLMDSWRWSSALWHGGVLTPAFDAEGGWPIEWVRAVAAEIAGGPAGPLKAVVGESRFEDTLAYLNAVCRDLTRGGADPGMSVPVSAGLSRYAGSLGAVEFVGEQDSTVGRLERRRMRVLGRVTLAVPRLMDGDEVIAVRGRAGEELEAAGGAIASALRGGGDRAVWDGARAACDAASASVREAVHAVDDRAGVSLVSIAFGVCDRDVVLRCATRASAVAQRVGVSGGRGAQRRRGALGVAGVEGGGVVDAGGGVGSAIAPRGVLRAVVRVLPFEASGSVGGISTREGS